MYVGRIVAAGCSKKGDASVMYRVSSRSFPNRYAVAAANKASIVPKSGYEGDVFKNPYIAYNCLRLVNDIAVVGNGSQTDPLADKIDSRMPIRDAFASVLLAMDYEHDDYNTPRIAAAVRADGKSGFLGIVSKDSLMVREFPLVPGRMFYVCTYEHTVPSSEFSEKGFDISNSAEGCDYILGQGVFTDFERPVTAVCARWAGEKQGFEVSTREFGD